ncbi:MAG: Crp/Fnr family transcriptional regulator [Saprospirales bacterium]|nr:MAG: Crp/Fnr family transcriptional regulator [Saprospirales bacterium]
MTEKDKLQIELRRYFPQLSDEKLREEIMRVSRIVPIKRDETIINYGSFVKMIPLVIKGCIRVTRQFEDGRELFLYHLYPGETCAISVSCCMSLEPSPFFAIAEDDSEVIGIPVDYIDIWQSKYTVWNKFMISVYEDRFKELVLSLDDIAFKKLDERLLTYLRKKSEAMNSFDIDITHQQIAEELNTARESISRLLKAMESKGLIKLGRNTIKILKN